VKELSDFVRDDEKLREERKKAKKNKDKYVGMSGLTASMRYNYGRHLSVWTAKHMFCACSYRLSVTLEIYSKNLVEFNQFSSICRLI